MFYVLNLFIRFILIVYTIVSLGCLNTDGSGIVVFDPRAISLEAREMLEAYHEDMNREGLGAEFKYLDSSEAFFWVPPGYRSALSYDSVQAILEANARALSSVKFTWDTLRIIPLSNDIATFSGIVNGETTDTAGTTTSTTIIESGTLIRREDGWKLLSGQSAVVRW